MKRRGFFITFEGGEGCGKTTHARFLRDHLARKGFKVVLTREPGGTAFGKRIRKSLLFGRHGLSHVTELLLFAADRCEHVDKVIAPSLDAGKVVICDRYVDSTVAYQISGRRLPEDLVRYLNMTSSGGIVPDLTFLLDIPARDGIARARKAGGGRDRFETERRPFHEAVRRAYLGIAKNEPGRVVVVNSRKQIEHVRDQIMSVADGRISQGRGVPR